MSKNQEFRYFGYNNAMKEIIRLPGVESICGQRAEAIKAGAESASSPVGDTPCEYYVMPYKSDLGNTCFVVGTKNWASRIRNAKNDTLQKGLKHARG